MPQRKAATPCHASLGDELLTGQKRHGFCDTCGDSIRQSEDLSYHCLMTWRPQWTEAGLALPLQSRDIKKSVKDRTALTPASLAPDLDVTRGRGFGDSHAPPSGPWPWVRMAKKEDDQIGKGR